MLPPKEPYGALTPEVVSNAGTEDWKIWNTYFPGVNDIGEMWHILYFAQDPVNFVNAAIGHLNTLDANEQAAYITTIHDWIFQNFNQQEIVNLLSAVPSANLVFFVGRFFPEFQEWSQSVFIARDFQTWLKSSIQVNQLLEGESKKAQAAKVVEWIQKYGPKNGLELLPDGFVRFATDKMKTDMNTASFKLDSSGSKIFVTVLIGGVGIWGISKLFSKK